MIAASISLHHTGVDSEAFTPDQPCIHASKYHRLKCMAQNVAVAEAAVTIDRERRMIGDRVVEIEPAEPSVGQMQLNLLAQPPLKADAVTIPNDQHPQQELGINRRAANSIMSRIY